MRLRFGGVRRLRMRGIFCTLKATDFFSRFFSIYKKERFRTLLLFGGDAEIWRFARRPDKQSTGLFNPPLLSRYIYLLRG